MEEREEWGGGGGWRRTDGQGQLHSAHGSWFGLKGGRVIAGSVGVMPTEVVPSHPPWDALSVGCGLHYVGTLGHVCHPVSSLRGKLYTPGGWSRRSELPGAE